MLTVSVGALQLLITGTFLGVNTFHETVTRYVSEPTTAATSVLGETSGRSEVVRAGPAQVVRNLPQATLGRFRSRGDAGRLLAAVTFPEWVAGLVLLPVAVWSGYRALFGTYRMLLVPWAFLVGFGLILAYTYGDDWTTFRFRLIAWPAYLCVAAVSSVHAYESLRRQHAGGVRAAQALH
jgi:hypothetical protein